MLNRVGRHEHSRAKALIVSESRLVVCIWLLTVTVNIVHLAVPKALLKCGSFVKGCNQV